MLYIMRHGKTDWNIQHKLQGHTDIPLNEEGRQMAKQAREDYLNIPIDICYCSPLIRARETAELVLQGRNIPILCDDRLMELRIVKIFQTVRSACCFGIVSSILLETVQRVCRNFGREPVNF